jgi:hypothetical protein
MSGPQVYGKPSLEQSGDFVIGEPEPPPGEFLWVRAKGLNLVITRGVGLAPVPPLAKSQSELAGLC